MFVTGADGTLEIRELRRSASDPKRAEPGAGRLVLGQPHARAAAPARGCAAAARSG